MGLTCPFSAHERDVIASVEELRYSPYSIIAIIIGRGAMDII